MSKKSNRVLSLQFLLLIVFAAVLGVIGAASTIAFIEALKVVHQIIWEDIPGRFNINTDLYIVLAALVGGVLVGLAHKHFGPWPESLEEAMQRFKRTGEFDDKHIVVGVIASFAALGFGAALGPEAALIAVVGGVGTFIAKRISHSSRVLRNASQASLSAALGAVFGSVAAVAIPATTEKKLSSKVWTAIPGLVAAVVALYIMRHFADGGYFKYEFFDYTFSSSDLVDIIPVSLLSIFGGLVFVLTLKGVKSVVSKYKKHTVLVAMSGGLIFGLLATTSSLLLFSGHEGIQEIIDGYGAYDGNYLVIVGLAKALVAALLLATFWKGGRFFPMMFAGAAIGLGLTKGLDTIDPMVGLATGVGAALSVVVPKPFIVILLLLLVFPVDLLAFAVGGVIIGSLVGKAISSDQSDTITAS